MRQGGVVGGWAVLALAAAVGSPASGGPEGRWETFDDRTGSVRAVVRVVVPDGRLSGGIERIVPRPGEGPNPICARCEGSLRNKPVVGMENLAAGRGGAAEDPHASERRTESQP